MLEIDLWHYYHNNLFLPLYNLHQIFYELVYISLQTINYCFYRSILYLQEEKMLSQIPYFTFFKKEWMHCENFSCFLHEWTHTHTVLEKSCFTIFDLVSLHTFVFIKFFEMSSLVLFCLPYFFIGLLVENSWKF